MIIFNKNLGILWISVLILTIVPVNAYGIEKYNPDYNNIQQIGQKLEWVNATEDKTIENTAPMKNTTVIPSKRYEKIFGIITIGLLSSNLSISAVNTWANIYGYLNVALWTMRMFWVSFVLTGISLGLTLGSIDDNWRY